MQFLGNMSQSWTLVSSAARTLVLFFYHLLKKDKAEDNQKHEAHTCVFWCCSLDKILSALFMKPSSFPGMSRSSLAFIESDFTRIRSTLVGLVGNLVWVLEGAFGDDLNCTDVDKKNYIETSDLAMQHTYLWNHLSIR